VGIFSFLSGKKKSTHTSSGSSQPNSPQSQSINESNKAIENLIANKDKYQNNQIAGDNRNEYQMRMQALKTGQTFDPSNFTFTDRKGNQINPGSDNKTIGNAGGAEAYKKKFPITSGIQNLVGAASNLIPGVGMAKSILGVLNKMGGKVKSGASLVGDKTGITDSKVYRDLANAPSGFISDLKNMLTIDDGNKEETVSLDIESIKNDKKIKKNNFINTDNLSEEQKLELLNKAQTAGEIVNNSTVNQIVNSLPYQYQANQNDFDALRGNRSLDFSQLAGAPKEGDNRFNYRFNNVGIGGVTLDNTAYRNYLANKAGYPDTGINNINMIKEMKDNPTLINRESPTGLNFNALGEVSNPQDLDASLRDEFLNRRII
jgi:hypothetical protein